MAPNSTAPDGSGQVPGHALRKGELPPLRLASVSREQPVDPGRGRGVYERAVAALVLAERVEERAVLAEPVLLVVVLGAPEPAGGADVGDDAFAERVAGLPRQLRPLLAVREDEAGVLARVALRARVVAAPEDVEQLLVRDDARVEVDLDRFGVVAEVLVGRGVGRAAGIADARADDAGDAPEPGVGSPESAEGEGRGLQRGGGGGRRDELGFRHGVVGAGGQEDQREREAHGLQLRRKRRGEVSGLLPHPDRRDPVRGSRFRLDQSATSTLPSVVARTILLSPSTTRARR